MYWILTVLVSYAQWLVMESKHACGTTRAGKCGTVPLSAVNTLAKKVLNILAFSSLLDGMQRSHLHNGCHKYDCVT